MEHRCIDFYRYHHFVHILNISLIHSYSTCSDHCPPSYSQCVDNYCSCSEGRNGTLCGQCIDGYSVAINSPYMSCVPCNSSLVYKGWALLIALEFIPITVMVAIIAVLNVNLNQGSLSGYIFLCQMITIPFASVGYPS